MNKPATLSASEKLGCLLGAEDETEEPVVFRLITLI